MDYGETGEPQESIGQPDSPNWKPPDPNERICLKNQSLTFTYT